MEIEVIFEKAAEHAKTSIGEFSPENILKLYGLYKQACQGDNNTPKPYAWNVTARQKWEAWALQRNKSREQAMMEYVETLTQVKPGWMEEPTRNWVHHSRMKNEEDDVKEADKDAFYWVKENNPSGLKKALENGLDINVVDGAGLGLCHWAADRGHVQVMRLLLTSGADPNLKDEVGQSALHYAACCGHADVVALLIQHGANPTLTDDDGQKPCDVCEVPEIMQILKCS